MSYKSFNIFRLKRSLEGWSPEGYFSEKNKNELFRISVIFLTVYQILADTDINTDVSYASPSPVVAHTLRNMRHSFCPSWNLLQCMSSMFAIHDTISYNV